MFCPGCGTQNEGKQAYCRQCGQGLLAVQVALEGNADQSIEKLKASQEWVNAGSATLSIFTLIGLIIAFIGFASNSQAFINIAIINLILGSTIGLPLIYAGKVNLTRAARLLTTSQSESSHAKLAQPLRPDKLLTNGLDEKEPGLPKYDSITEHTTLNLRG